MLSGSIAMAHPFWLSNEAWAVLEPHLPVPGRGRRGRPRRNDQRVISGILFVLRTGCQWRDIPFQYGPASTVFNQYNRWRRSGVWQTVNALINAMETTMQINQDGTRDLPRHGFGGKSATKLAEVPYVVDFQI